MAWNQPKTKADLIQQGYKPKPKFLFQPGAPLPSLMWPPPPGAGKPVQAYNDYAHPSNDKMTRTPLTPATPRPQMQQAGDATTVFPIGPVSGPLKAGIPSLPSGNGFIGPQLPKAGTPEFNRLPPSIIASLMGENIRRNQLPATTSFSPPLPDTPRQARAALKASGGIGGGAGGGMLPGAIGRMGSLLQAAGMTPERGYGITSEQGIQDYRDGVRENFARKSQMNQPAVPPAPPISAAGIQDSNKEFKYWSRGPGGEFLNPRQTERLETAPAPRPAPSKNPYEGMTPDQTVEAMRRELSTDPLDALRGQAVQDGNASFDAEQSRLEAERRRAARLGGNTGPENAAKAIGSGLDNSSWNPDLPNGQAPRGDIAQSRFQGAMTFQNPGTGRANFIDRSQAGPFVPSNPINSPGDRNARLLSIENNQRAKIIGEGSEVPPPPVGPGIALNPATPVGALAAHGATSKPGYDNLKRAAYLDSRKNELADRKARRMENAQAEATQRRQRMANRDTPPSPLDMAAYNNPELAARLAEIQSENQYRLAGLGLQERGIGLQERGMAQSAEEAKANRELDRERMLAGERTSRAGLDASAAQAAQQNELGLAEIKSREGIASKDRDSEVALKQYETRMQGLAAEQARLEDQVATGASTDIDADKARIAQIQQEIYSARVLPPAPGTAAPQAKQSPPPPPVGGSGSSVAPLPRYDQALARTAPEIAQELQAIGAYGWDDQSSSLSDAPGMMMNEFGLLFGAPGNQMDRRAEYMAGRLLKMFENRQLDDSQIRDIASVLSANMDKGFIDSLDNPDVGTVGKEKARMTPARQFLSHVLKGKKYSEFKWPSEDDRKKTRNTDYDFHLRNP